MSDKNITRLIYESYQGYLNESEENSVQNQRLLDISPKIIGGKMFLYVNMHDESMFGLLKTLASDLLKNNLAKTKATLGRDLTKDEYDKIMDEYTTKSEKDTNGNIVNEWVRILICNTSLMGEIFDEDGNIANSDTYSLIVKRLMLILKKLESYNFYIGEEQIKDIFRRVFYYAKTIPSKEQLQEIKNNTDELFFKLCNTLGEEKTRSLLGTIEFGSDDVVFDYQLALNNKLRVIVQAEKYDTQGANQVNTISYLATQRQWAKLGRYVVDYKYPYFIDVAHGGRGNIKAENDELSKMGKTLGHGGFKGRRARNALTNANVNGINSFGYHTYYDVSATQTIPGIEDKFTSEPGMINNLTGALNDKAIEHMNSLGLTGDANADRTDQLNKIFDTSDYSNVDLTYQATCLALGSKPLLANDADIKNKIAETGNIISKRLIKWVTDPKGGGMIKPENYMPLVKIGTLMVQIIIRLPMDNVKNVSLPPEYKEMIIAMKPKIQEIAMAISNAKRDILSSKTKGVEMNEMIGIYSNLFIFEENFNKTLNLIVENATKI